MKNNTIANLTRMEILGAANRVVLTRGVNALTLDAVALEAGVSKGGLLYHFPSKNKLIEGMVEYLIKEFDSILAVELEKNNGDWLSAYIHASFQENTKLDQVGSALFAAAANNPELLKPLQDHYAQWQQQAETSAPSPELGLIIRMALDGLWISDLLDFSPPDQAMRRKMLTTLLKLAGRDAN